MRRLRYDHRPGGPAFNSGGGGGWHEAVVLVCLPLAAPIGLSPLYILTLCGSERISVVSTEPLDDLSCLTTPGVGCCPRAVARAVDQVHPDAHSESMLGLPTPALTCAGVCICRIICLTGASNSPLATYIRYSPLARPPCVTFRLVVAPLRGPGRSPVLPFACCVGSLLSVGRCGRCSCWCRFRVRGPPPKSSIGRPPKILIAPSVCGSPCGVDSERAAPAVGKEP